MKHQGYSCRPVLDPDFIPAACWTREYLARTKTSAGEASEEVSIFIERDTACVSTFHTSIGTSDDASALLHLERLLKFLLWKNGGWRVLVTGGPAACNAVSSLKQIYSSTGSRAFDTSFMSRVYGRVFEIEYIDRPPSPNDRKVLIRQDSGGCRIGFDLGGSDRKFAAIMDGKVLHTGETRWDPYNFKDPGLHYEGLLDSITAAASRLPRVDAIGGSSAGIIIGNRVRVSSLFRGVPEEVFFSSDVPGMFERIGARFNAPIRVVNDGEVTALAGARFLGTTSVLGVALGTSEASGFVDNAGNLTSWINELAFAPVDYRPDAPVDEWSGDSCGVQYHSQQAVGRLLPVSGIEFPASMPLPEKLAEVQKMADAGDQRALRIFETLGAYLGHSIAHYHSFYRMRNVLLLGRVMSGTGGTTIMQKALETLKTDYRNLEILIHAPGERDKRHGQAVTAAFLPTIKTGRKVIS